jgi:opine dehydrogenase
LNVLSRRPEVWDSKIIAHTQKSIWEHKGEMTGKINKTSKHAKDVVPGSQIILICSPAHTKVDILKEIKPYLEHGAFVGTIFGQGGFDMQARFVLGDDVEKKNLTIFSLQYVPFLCKVVNYGKDVNIIGPKKHLYVTSYPVERVHQVCSIMSLAYFIPSVPLPNFLSLTLCPSN